MKGRQNQKDPEITQHDATMVLSRFGSHLPHALDIYTDLNLAHKIYMLSREDVEMKYDYNE